MTTLSCGWPISSGPQLAPGEAHVWFLPLDLSATGIEELRVLLSEDERARAERFHFERHRRRFIACRGQVRRVLAGYLNDSAERLRFQYGSRGKPALEAPWCDSEIAFNVSNSHEVALCALALDRELGVDVEQVVAPSDFDGLAAHFFAKSEV